VTLAAALVAVAGIVYAGVVQAHATIGSVALDATYTKVIATSRGQDIAPEAGTYGLRVFDPSGAEVTSGATRVTGPKTMEVNVTALKAAGQYRVNWKTRSAGDGDDAKGDLLLFVPVSAISAAPTAAPAAPVATPAPVSPPSTGDAGLIDQTGAGSWTLVVIGVATLGTVALVRRRVA
jgi:methionine-rich copper-binding protein CopC